MPSNQSTSINRIEPSSYVQCGTVGLFGAHCLGTACQTLFVLTMRVCLLVCLSCCLLTCGVAATLTMLLILWWLALYRVRLDCDDWMITQGADRMTVERVTRFYLGEFQTTLTKGGKYINELDPEEERALVRYIFGSNYWRDCTLSITEYINMAYTYGVGRSLHDFPASLLLCIVVLIFVCCTPAVSILLPNVSPWRCSLFAYR